MPYIFKFFVNNTEVFHALLESEQCSANTATGHRCRRRVVIGQDLCYSHLLSLKHLRIKPSTITGAGNGLFALDSRQPPNAVLFHKGDRIGEYIGERLDLAELAERYGNYTAPYTMKITNNEFLDSATKRGYCSLANRATTANQANAEFPNCNYRVVPHKIYLVAKKDIRNGDEILTSYGKSYRMNGRERNETKKVR